MQLNILLLAGLLATVISPVFAGPTPADKKHEVLKKDEIIHPYCANSPCALYCEFRGRYDTNKWSFSCDKVGALFDGCEASCRKAATTGYSQHFGSATERAKLKAARSGLGQSCLKGWSWVSNKAKSCK